LKPVSIVAASAAAPERRMDWIGPFDAAKTNGEGGAAPLT